MQDQNHPEKLLESLRRLSDDELVARLKSLAARERRTTALLVAHLAELDTRDVHLRAGYPTLFLYCRNVLALSEHEAYNRMEVARTARRFPVVLDLLAEGTVNLTTVRLLGPHLTPHNHAAVLESARGKRKAEVEEIVAALSPRPDVPASIRKLPPRDTSTALGSPGSGAASPIAPIAPIALAAPIALVDTSVASDRLGLSPADLSPRPGPQRLSERRVRRLPPVARATSSGVSRLQESRAHRLRPGLAGARLITVPPRR